MEIIETSVFTKRIVELLSDDDYREFQVEISNNPELGDLIPHGGGLRKVRWKGSNHGKRGGTRIIYYWFSKNNEVLMLFVYAKNEKDDLTDKQLKILRDIMEREYHG